MPSSINKRGVRCMAQPCVSVSRRATRSAAARSRNQGDRDFLEVVLSPGARAIAIPVATGGASTGLLYPGDRVDVILTQTFKNDPPLIRRSVSETVVESLRVLAVDTPDPKSHWCEQRASAVP